VVDLFWDRRDLHDEFRVEVKDRRDGTRLEPVRELARVRVIEKTFDDVGREGPAALRRRVGTGLT
jgi:hypothetical protein